MLNSIPKVNISTEVVQAFKSYTYPFEFLITGIADKLKENFREINIKKASFEAIGISTDFTHEGKNGNRILVVSLMEAKEQTISVIYVDLDLPSGRETVTRHYQPMKYLGYRNDVVTVKSVKALPNKGQEGKVYNVTDTGAAYVWNGFDYNQLPPQEVQNAINVKKKVSRSNCYTLMVTRLPIEELDIHANDWLLNGNLPDAYDENKHKEFHESTDNIVIDERKVNENV